MAFLDNAGVGRLWAHILSKINKKADKFTVGEGLQMIGDKLNAEVKKADIDRLSEEINNLKEEGVESSGLPDVSGADNGKMLVVQDGEWAIESPANVIEPDNTLPVTSAAVYATVGNIKELLKTI